MKAETEKIIEMVEKGMIAKEIKKELGIKPKAPLRGMYYKAWVEAGKIKDILTEKEVKKVAPKCILPNSIHVKFIFRSRCWGGHDESKAIGIAWFL